jgi:hypothetical protein
MNVKKVNPNIFQKNNCGDHDMWIRHHIPLLILKHFKHIHFKNTGIGKKKPI